MLDVEGFILVGGASSRMGNDKSRLLIKGKTTVELIAEALRPVTSNVSVVGSRGEATADGLPNIPDLHERWGPLGGIQAALHACKTEYCFVVACDLPFVTAELFQALLGRLSQPAHGTEAVVPVQSDGRPQPLCSIYKREPCLAATDLSISIGEHTPRALLDKVGTRYVGFSELANLEGSEYFFTNLNRPEDYERAKEIWALYQNRPQQQQ